MKYRLFLLLAWVGSWLTLLMPIGIMLYENREKYFKTVEASLQIGGAVIVILIVVTLLALKKAKFGVLTWFVLGYVILELVEPMLADLKLMVLILAISVAVDKYIFKGLIAYFKRLSMAQIEANINAKAMGKVFNKKPNMEELSGRV